ncbi:MAG: Peptidylprolyl isomerase [Pedosphaera sp.]|nr:Peptidylprolyl isomerase [Pedosphaera sp.]
MRSITTEFMKSKMKTFGVLLAATTMTTVALAVSPDNKPAAEPAASAPKLDAFLPDSVIAKGKGFEIKRSQLDEALVGVKATATSRGQEIPPAQLGMIEKRLLDRLIQIQILKAKANDAQKAEGKKEGDKRFEMIKKRAPSEEMLAKQLKSMNLTLDVLQSRLVEEATAEAVLKSNIKITDEQVKKFYDDNPSQFEEPEMVRASHILIGTKDAKTGEDLKDDQKKAKKKQAEDLLKRARAGEDFAKLAKEFSEDPGSKDNGGEYTFGKGKMVPEFEAAAFSLKTNQISDVVTTQFGYHIIKLSEKMPAKKVEFDKVKTEIKDYLERQEMDKMLPDYYAKIKKEADVQILDEKMKALDDAEVSANAAPKPDAGKDAKDSKDKPAAK